MSPLRSWLERLLGHGEEIEPDPETIVEAAYVRYPATNVVMTELAAAGIQASAADEREQGGEGPVTHSRILVRYADVGAAREVIDDVTTTG
jgi:hypothetical protein